MNSLPGLRAIHALLQCGLPEDATYAQLAETIGLFEAALELDASLPPNQCAIPGASRARLEEVAPVATGSKAAATAGATTATAVGGKGSKLKAGAASPAAVSSKARPSMLQQQWAGFWCTGDLVFASFSNWGWWPSKILEFREKKAGSIECRILFFAGFKRSPCSPPVEEAKEWLPAHLVQPFTAKALRQVAGRYKTSCSMFPYFQHDLSAALGLVRAAVVADADSRVSEAVATAAEMVATTGAAASGGQGGGGGGGASIAWEAQEEIAAQLRALCAEPHRERWSATVERHAAMLDQWALRVVVPLQVPQVTAMVLYVPPAAPSSHSSCIGASGNPSGGHGSGNSVGHSSPPTKDAYECDEFVHQVCRPDNDFYAELGCSSKATSAELKACYQAGVRAYHPDKAWGNQVKFQRLATAYETLKRTEARTAYDAMRRAELEAIDASEKENAEAMERERLARKRGGMVDDRRSIRAKGAGNASSSSLSASGSLFEDSLGVGNGMTDSNGSNSNSLWGGSGNGRRSRAAATNNGELSAAEWYQHASGGDAIICAIACGDLAQLETLVNLMRLRPAVSALLVAVETNCTEALAFLLAVNPALALSVTTAAMPLARHPRSQGANGWICLHHAAVIPGRAHMIPLLSDAATKAQDERWLSAYGPAYKPPEQLAFLPSSPPKSKKTASAASPSSPRAISACPEEHATSHDSGTGGSNSSSVHGNFSAGSSNSAGAVSYSCNSSSSLARSSTTSTNERSKTNGNKKAGKVTNVTRAASRGDHGGMTPLHHAAKVGEPEAVRALLACGGDPLAVCKQRFTALHWLCGETVHQGHVDCAYLLTSASSSLVNVADKRGLTALHWANAEQHVKLMKLLLAKGAVWSDADLLSMCDDVTLGHERRPIRIDLFTHLEGGPNSAVGRELLSRLRRFVYIKDCVSETDSASLLTVGSSGSNAEGSSYTISGSSSNGASSSSSSGGVVEGALKRSGCDCADCYANESRCPCVRLNGQRLPYVPLRQGNGDSRGSGANGGGGAVKGVILEGSLSMTRTKVFECTPWCASAKHRFIPDATALLAYPNKAKNERAALASAKSAEAARAHANGAAATTDDAAEVARMEEEEEDNGDEEARTAGGASAPIAVKNNLGKSRPSGKTKNRKWNHSKGGKSSSISSKTLSAQDREAARREAEFQRVCCKGVNYCQQGVGPVVALMGYGNGKGFGVVAQEPLVKGQFVCTYNAEILEEKDGAAREQAWNIGGAALGGRAALPTAFALSLDGGGSGGSVPSSPAPSTPVRARGRKRSVGGAAGAGAASPSPMRSSSSSKGAVEADDEERAAAAAAVPGAVMNQITFQIYLDKSCGSKVFDGTIFANIARFMNHSCDPNLKVIKIECGRPYPLLGFFCQRNVAAGEELTWNYDNSGGGKKSKSGIVCLCGSTNCRGFI